MKIVLFSETTLWCSNTMTTSDISERHVYFGSDVCLPRDNSIIVKQNSPGYIQIHLGFLQLDYSYSMSVEIPKCYFLEYNIQAILDAAEKSTPNVNCKIISIKEEQDFYEFIIEFHAQKERLLKEELKFCLDEEVKIVLEFNARVLGPGKGTPFLKDGIRCIGVAKDDLSEASDWQGHNNPQM